MFFQNKFRKIQRDQRGVSLIVTLGALAVLIILATGVSKMVLSFIRSASQVEQANIAFLAAESGVELALYDLVAFEDGYQIDHDPSKKVCGKSSDIDLSRTTNFDKICNDPRPYRFVNFTDSALSGGRGFWQLFSRTLKNRDDDNHVIPNPYFAGDNNGRLTANEWSELTKDTPVNFNLLLDENPNAGDPQGRFIWVWEDGEKNLDVILWADGDWDADKCVDVDTNGLCDHNDALTDDEEEIFTWMFSAIDGSGEEFTLQGVAIESDFSDSSDYDGDGTNDFGFIFDLNENSALLDSDGDVFAGEDINENLPSSQSSGVNKFNRVSGIEESGGFEYATPQEFLGDLDDAMNEIAAADQWSKASLTLNLIGTLAETSDIASNALKYKIVIDDEQLADSSTYIISEGFAGNIKQTIQTRFIRESAIPIFSYVIFQ